jgi:hypothetical protein
MPASWLLPQHQIEAGAVAASTVPPIMVMMVGGIGP